MNPPKSRLKSDGACCARSSPMVVAVSLSGFGSVLFATSVCTATRKESAAPALGRIAEQNPVIPPKPVQMSPNCEHGPLSMFVCGSTQCRVREQVPPGHSVTDLPVHLAWLDDPRTHCPKTVGLSGVSRRNTSKAQPVGGVGTDIEGAIHVEGDRRIRSLSCLTASECVGLLTLVTSISQLKGSPTVTCWTGMQVEQSLAARQSVLVEQRRRPASGPPTQSPVLPGGKTKPEQSAAVLHMLPSTHSWQSELTLQGAPEALHDPATHVSWGKQPRSLAHGAPEV